MISDRRSLDFIHTLCWHFGHVSDTVSQGRFIISFFFSPTALKYTHSLSGKQKRYHWSFLVFYKSRLAKPQFNKEAETYPELQWGKQTLQGLVFL